ncbi:MAG: hypothetical protein K8963_08660, partial [Proteobacteria bacterium]|nr:hypothetical protein [Pseudomonadota bacterium]
MTEKTYRTPREIAREDIVFGTRYDQKTLSAKIEGLVPATAIAEIVDRLSQHNSDEYIESVLANGSDPTLTSAPEVIARLGRVEVLHESGPLYICRLMLSGDDKNKYTFGVIAQNRRTNNGAWLPEHHRTASKFLKEFSHHLYPVLTFVDTPGAEAGEQANLHNQAHSISHLIAEAVHARVPVISVLHGLGYSGGAIPLYCGNLLLALRGSVFSTIQPQGLSNIARKLDLSWQQCARIVGVSCWQLYQQGVIDAVIDYDPARPDDNTDLLIACLRSALDLLDDNARRSAVESDELNQEFRGYFQQTAPRLASHPALADAGLSVTSSSAFALPGAVGYYLQRQRQHHLYNRLQVSRTSRFGLLADDSIPAGEQLTRMRLERDANFYGWIQNTPRVVYDDKITRLWKRYASAREQRQQDRGRLTSILFGRPEENYRKAIHRLCSGLMSELYNQWKSNAEGNLERLIFWLQRSDRLDILYQITDIPRDYEAVLKRLSDHKGLFDLACRTFTHEGRKFLLEDTHQLRTDTFVRNQICLELNLLLNHPNLYSVLQSQTPGTDITVIEHEALRTSKTLLDQVLDIEPSSKKPAAFDKKSDELTLLDLLALPDLQPVLLNETVNLIVFNRLYNHLLGSMHLLSGHSEQRWSLDFDETSRLYGEICQPVIQALEKKYGLARTQLQDDFNEWIFRLGEDKSGASFLAVVDEWKRCEFPRVSDTFFAILSHVFYNVLPSLLRALHHSGNFDGRIQPLNIGQRKDFWNRLHLAYRDLQIDRLLTRYKREKPIGAADILKTFFSAFEEIDRDLISTDPCSFPGFRRSLDACIKADKTPSGVITGTANLKGKRRRIGVLVSNPEFQAGSFDMAACAKFIGLLDECEKDGLPVIMFVSSGGMQTKEGASPLFSMALTVQRITDFILRTHQPVLVFAFGDCTGGAQASFVTHP